MPTSHAVAVPEGRDADPVRVFKTMSCDLESIVRWLKDCHIDTVAMESTGVYWKPLFTLLIRYGFEVFLLKPDHVKNITDRKTGMSDAAWIQWLHSKSCYLHDEAQQTLRTLVRHRKTILKDSNSIDIIEFLSLIVLRRSEIVESCNTIIFLGLINSEQGVDLPLVLYISTEDLQCWGRTFHLQCRAGYLGPMRRKNGLWRALSPI